MKQINISIPDNLDFTDAELKLFIAAKLYEQGKISQGEAAEMASISKKSFIELIGKYSVSLFTQSVAEIQSDYKSAL